MIVGAVPVTVKPFNENVRGITVCAVPVVVKPLNEMVRGSTTEAVPVMGALPVTVKPVKVIERAPDIPPGLVDDSFGSERMAGSGVAPIILLVPAVGL